MNPQVLERRNDRWLTAVTVGVFCAGLTSCTVPQAQTSQPPQASASPTTSTKVLRVGFISSESSKVPIGPEGWAQTKGALVSDLKQAGIADVKFIPFNGGPALNEALATNALDVGIYGDTPALVAKATGLKTRLINQTRVGQNAWLLSKKDGPRTVADLKGTTIGVAKGTYMHRYLIGLLEQQGLTKAVTIAQIKQADAKVALERGDIAAYPFSIGTGPAIAAQGFPVIDEAKNHQGLVGSSVTIATEELLAQQPNFPQVWNQIRQKALQDIQANPEAFYEFASKTSNNLPIPLVKVSYPIDQYPAQPLTPDGLALLNSTKQFLSQQQLLKSDFDIQQWFVAQP